MSKSSTASGVAWFLFTTVMVGAVAVLLLVMVTGCGRPNTRSTSPIPTFCPKEMPNGGKLDTFKVQRTWDLEANRWTFEEVDCQYKVKM
jgi:hypothetical protein